MLPQAISQTDHRPFPPPDRKWLGAMTWKKLLFAHWPVDPKRLAQLLPENVELDTFEGRGWIGLVPFSMADVHTRFTPKVPGLSEFPEVNVRTYVRVNDVPGVWFFSLDAHARWFVELARRQYHIPYYRANMRMQQQDEGWVHYESQRNHPLAAPASLVCRYRPIGEAKPAEQGSLEHWLVERYCLFSNGLNVRGYRPGGRDPEHRKPRPIWRADIHHPPWQLAEAQWQVKTNAMLAPLGIMLPMTGVHLRYAEAISVVGWSPELVAGGSG